MNENENNNDDYFYCDDCGKLRSMEEEKELLIGKKLLLNICEECYNRRQIDFMDDYFNYEI